MITRPLLSGKLEDPSAIGYPVYATPKLDGIRVLKVDGKVVTRKFKPLPNVHTREFLEKYLPDGIDGEIMIRGCNDFNTIQSQIMTFDGKPNFEYYAFDYVKDDLNKPYLERMEDLKNWYPSSPAPIQIECSLVLPKQINNEKELLEFEDECLAKGYEGIMIRSGDGRYKCGRSTLKEGILLKVKKFHDDEAIIIGFKEKLKNENEQEEDEFGLAKRSKKKEGLVPADTLGSLIVRDLKRNVEFDVGSGFDDALREEVWKNKEKYLGQLAKYKYFELGPNEKPRFPVFLGFRHPDDV